VCDNVNNELVIYIYTYVVCLTVIFYLHIYIQATVTNFSQEECIDRSQNEFLCICRNNPDSSRCE
jgi:hypothetical protein